ncbi:MAG: hypothetical protein AAB263_08780 [Planctomycetota bacterium]
MIAKLLVTVIPKDGDGEVVTLWLWVSNDGRVRLLGSKNGFDFLTALVAADGKYTALALRTKRITHGRIGGATDPILLRDLVSLVSEVREGPLPVGAVITQGENGVWQFRDAATGWAAEVVRDPEYGMPTVKRLLGPDGTEQRRIDYKRWTTFAALLRPERADLVVAGDKDSYSFRIKSLESVSEISDDRLQLRVPPDAVEVTHQEFERHLGE